MADSAAVKEVKPSTTREPVLIGANRPEWERAAEFFDAMAKEQRIRERQESLRIEECQRIAYDEGVATAQQRGKIAGFLHFGAEIAAEALRETHGAPVKKKG